MPFEAFNCDTDSKGKKKVIVPKILFRSIAPGQKKAPSTTKSTPVAKTPATITTTATKPTSSSTDVSTTASTSETAFQASPSAHLKVGEPSYFVLFFFSVK